MRSKRVFGIPTFVTNIWLYIRTWFGIGAVGAGVMAILLWAPERMVQWVVSAPQTASEHLTLNEYGKLVDDYRKTLAQILIGLGALGTLYFSRQRSAIERETLRVSKLTLENTQDSKITERFAKAVEQLGALDKDGHKLLEVRFGGIYALERVARDSPDDHWTVMEILTAYVRENAPWAEGDDVTRVALSTPRDIQAILTVIGRRKVEYEEGKGDVKIELRKTDLHSADLSSANLKNAFLYRANLRWAYLRNANLILAYLREAHLEGAILDFAIMESTLLDDAHLEGATLQSARLKMAYAVGAHLEGADLRYAHLDDTNLKDAKLNGANLANARLDGTFLKGADLTSVIGLTKELLRNAVLDHMTKLPEEFQDLIPQAGQSPPSSWDVTLQ